MTYTDLSSDPNDEYDLASPEATAANDDDLVFQVGPPGVEDGTYPATVAALEPITVSIKGEYGETVEERDLIAVTFALDDGREIEGVASPKLGSENSKLRQWMNVWLGQDTAGMRLTRRDIIGRECLVEVGRDGKGFAKVTAVLPRTESDASDLA
jgi:hypothetical protein